MFITCSQSKWLNTKKNEYVLYQCKDIEHLCLSFIWLFYYSVLGLLFSSTSMFSSNFVFSFVLKENIYRELNNLVELNNDNEYRFF